MKWSNLVACGECGHQWRTFIKLVLRSNIAIFLFPFLRHLSKNVRILIVIFLLTFPPPYWQLLSSQFSIFPTVWSVGGD